MTDEKSSSTLNLKVLTPDGPILEGEVHEVTLPGSEGEMGIYPDHAALLTKIIPGRLSYRAPDGDDTAALGHGVAEIQNNEVRILVNRAALREELDVSTLEERKKKILDEIDRETHAEKIVTLEEELLLTEVELEVAGGA